VEATSEGLCICTLQTDYSKVALAINLPPAYIAWLVTKHIGEAYPKSVYLHAAVVHSFGLGR
jgi:hypothetical protein